MTRTLLVLALWALSAPAAAQTAASSEPEPAPLPTATAAPADAAPANAAPATAAPPNAAPATAAPATAAPATVPGSIGQPSPQPVPVAAPPEPVPVTPTPLEADVDTAVAPGPSSTYAAAPRFEPGRPIAPPGGLYIRIAAGFGLPFGPDISDDYDDRDGEELRFTGQALALDLQAGAAVLPWLVVGGGLIQDIIAKGTVKSDAGLDRPIDRGLYYTVIGPFVDVYAAPPAGLHVQAMLGFAHISPSYDLGEAATGFGTVLGIGYELRTSKRWNVGVLGRVAFSSLDRGKVDGEEPKPTVYEPALLVTATFFPEAT